MTPPSPTISPSHLQGRTAGPVSRALAAVADALVVLGIAVLTGPAVGAVRFLVSGPPFAVPRPSDQVTAVFGCCLAVGYLAAGWSVTGRTVGGRLMGLRVVRRSGRRLRAGRALLRAVLCVALPLGLLWALPSRRNASVADLVVRSAVVHDWHGRYGGRAARRTGVAGSARRPLPREQRGGDEATAADGGQHDQRGGVGAEGQVGDEDGAGDRGAE